MDEDSLKKGTDVDDPPEEDIVDLEESSNSLHLIKH